MSRELDGALRGLVVTVAICIAALTLNYIFEERAVSIGGGVYVRGFQVEQFVFPGQKPVLVVR